MFCTLLTTLLFTPSADTQNYAKPELLIEVVDLAKADSAKGLHILDARPRAKYEAGHIPGALWVDVADWSKAFENGKDADGWTKRIGALGIDTTTPVVVYGDATSPDAARVWWILRFWGVRDVRLLNGGWMAWKDANGQVSTEESKVQSVNVKLKAQPGRLATKDQMLQGLKDKSFQIVDARSVGEYCGDVKNAKKAGAVPDSKHLEWSDLLDPKTQRFKVAAELAKLFEERGIKLDRPMTT